MPEFSSIQGGDGPEKKLFRGKLFILVTYFHTHSQPLLYNADSDLFPINFSQDCTLSTFISAGSHPSTSVNAAAVYLGRWCDITERAPA